MHSTITIIYLVLGLSAALFLTGSALSGFRVPAMIVTMIKVSALNLSAMLTLILAGSSLGIKPPSTSVMFLAMSMMLFTLSLIIQINGYRQNDRTRSAHHVVISAEGRGDL